MSKRGADGMQRGKLGGWTEARCSACGGKLYVYAMETALGMIEAQCPDSRCKAKTTVVFRSEPEAPKRSVPDTKNAGRENRLPPGYELWRCPHCDHPNPWPSHMAGRAILCPGCHERIKVGR